MSARAKKRAAADARLAEIESDIWKDDKDPGFDYQKALRELGREYSYDQIAHAMGYRSKARLNGILKGGEPLHSRGEALYILYTSTFHRDPPFRKYRAPDKRYTKVNG